MDFVTEQNCITCLRDGEEMGEVTFPPDGAGTVVINHTYVDPALRGRGLADELVRRAAEELRRTALPGSPALMRASGFGSTRTMRTCWHNKNAVRRRHPRAARQRRGAVLRRPASFSRKPRKRQKNFASVRRRTCAAAGHRCPRAPRPRTLSICEHEGKSKPGKARLWGTAAPLKNRHTPPQDAEGDAVPSGISERSARMK